jgi:hypothetical protein
MWLTRKVCRGFLHQSCSVYLKVSPVCALVPGAFGGSICYRKSELYEEYEVKASNLFKASIAAFGGSVALLTVSCGGGGGSPVDPGPGSGGPAAGTADLNGQLVQSGAVRAASAAGDGLSGIEVALINQVTGQLQGMDLTDSTGKFEFKAIPSGQGFLIKVEFTSSQDLNGDGLLDEIELFFPVSMADRAIANLIQRIGLGDSDGDGQLDSVEVEIELGDNRGNHESHRRQHRHRDGRTVEDSDDDGSFDDSDSSFDDSNSDGLPDNGSGINSAEVRGNIEALTASSITVNGVTFTTTAATEWQVGENHHASPSVFSAGQWVKVEGFRNAAGELIAHEVKDAAADNGGGGSDDDDNDLPGEREVRGNIEALSATSITVAGLTFAITAGTEWQAGDNHNASPSQFSVGQWAKVEGFLEDGVLTAREVKDAAADNGGSGGDDDDDDNDNDNDNDNDDDNDDDDDDDNSGSGSGDDDDDDNSGSDDDD